MRISTCAAILKALWLQTEQCRRGSEQLVLGLPGLITLCPVAFGWERSDC